MNDAKEEVRSRIAIEDVIGEYIQLKRAGRSYKGLSPFSAEKTPSFFVSPDKNIWHDFSTNKGGDIFAFIMEVEGMDFKAALEYLARKAGVDLSLYDTRRDKDLARRKERLYKANKLAALYFQQCFVKSKTAQDYIIKKRRLNKQVIQDFLIGYAPENGNMLTAALLKKGFSKKELDDAGLTNRFGSDMFRGRMMIPLMDSCGRVVGFTGRIIADIPNAPKYLNTSQTLLYDKSRHIFGFSQAKEAIRTKGYAVVVEGNLDVVSSHQAGVAQVVATAGTAMTEHHLKALKRLVGDVRLGFDSDKAGIAATERAIAIASQVGLDLAIISLPDTAKDPDELIKDEPAKWQAAIDAKEPAVDWILRQYEQRVDLKTAAGKRDFTTAALGVVRTLEDPVERDHYEQKIASITATSLTAVQAKLGQQDDTPPQLKEVKAAKIPAITAELHKDLDDALAIASLDGSSQRLFTTLQTAPDFGPERQALMKYFVQHSGTPLQEVPPELQEHANYVTMILLRADKRQADHKQSDTTTTAALVRKVEYEYTKQTKLRLAAQLNEAVERGDTSTANALNDEIKRLNKETFGGK